MKRLIPQFGDAKLASRGDAFVTLARSVVGQQISVKAAQTVWDRFSQLSKPALTPARVLKLKVDDMRAAGLSTRKVEYIQCTGGTQWTYYSGPAEAPAPGRSSSRTLISSTDHHATRSARGRQDRYGVAQDLQVLEVSSSHGILSRCLSLSTPFVLTGALSEFRASPLAPRALPSRNRGESTPTF